MSELNPALAESRYCPRCTHRATIDYPRSISCEHCGYGAYFNAKPVAAAIPVTETGAVILLRRAFDPGKHLWTFPGGFVDLGESVEDAAHRETDEALEARAFPPDEIPWQELAFWSTTRALRDFLSPRAAVAAPPS